MVANSLNLSFFPKSSDAICSFKEKRFFYSDYVSALLSCHTLNRLEQRIGKEAAGLLFVRVDDFYGFVASNGDEQGVRLLKQLQARLVLHFQTLLPEYDFIALDSPGINNTLLSFSLPENVFSYPQPEILENFTTNLESDIHQDFIRNDGCRIAIAAGVSPINYGDEGFYRALFKAYCAARQAAGQPVVNPKTASDIRQPSQAAGPETPPFPACVTSVRHLMHSGLTMPPETTVQRAKQQIELDGAARNSVVVIREGIPLGLVMNYYMDRKLGTRYGVSLYYYRPVTRLMNPDPLIVDINTSVEDAAKAAMNRPEPALYDDIIVVENEKYAGTVTVQKMLDHLAENQVRIAMGANPLTRLPGNIVIEQEIERRIRDCRASSLIYIDLDNFKVYNDAYGFENGDRMILFAAQVIKSVAGEKKRNRAFVGHVGGDDFIVISDQDQAEPIAHEIIGSFESGVGQHYSKKHRETGYIIGKGRDGIERQYPFVSLSIGIIDCEFKHPFTMDELSLRVAEIKKYAKLKTGSSFVRDRRAPIGGKPGSAD